MKRLIRSVLAFLIVLSSFSMFSSRIWAANIPTYPDYKEDTDTYYFVANYYWEIWRGTGGDDDWRGGVRPGDSVKVDYDYTFDFPGRKILDVSVNRFEPSQSVLVGGTQITIYLG